MLPLAQMQKILLEKDHDKQRQMIDALTADEKDKLLPKTEKLAKEGKELVEKYRR